MSECCDNPDVNYYTYNPEKYGFMDVYQIFFFHRSFLFHGRVSMPL